MVRQRDGGTYEIVAGERRWRAAQRAGIHEVPAIIRELSDGEALEIALIENIQRADLNPLEEARGYAQLMSEFAYTQQQLADSLGKSRSHIANTLRLLNLPDSVRAHIEAGRLTAGHARTLVAADGSRIACGAHHRDGTECPPGRRPHARQFNDKAQAAESEAGEEPGYQVARNAACRKPRTCGDDRRS